MKNIYFIVSFFLFISACSLKKQLPVIDVKSSSDPIEEKLKMLESVSYEAIEADTSNFKKAYKLMIEQPLDHADPSRGTFTQKVYLSHRDFEAPMVMNINGYSVPNNGFTSELVPWLKSNFMHVEHRFFGESMPDSLDYRFLTIEQAAKDHHRIIEILKKIYPGKWLSTGISKGGQATIFHSRFFPEDVDVSIPYVAPVNLAKEDERLVEFLDEVGSEDCRAKVLEYQRSLLSNYDTSLELFQKRSMELKQAYPMSIEKAFELSVLEFEFAYWQWSGGENCDLIPGNESNTDELINYLFTIDAPGFFTTSSIDYFFPFFYQAYAELGMYGYSVDSLDGYLKEYTAYVDNYYSFIPPGMEVVYNPKPLKEVHHYLLNEADHFIFVYGENDAWSATAFVPDENKTNSIVLFKEDGSHFTRISNLSDQQKEKAFSKLEEWLDIDIED